MDVMFAILSDEAEFNNIVGDADMSLPDAMKKIDITGNGILFIQNENRKLEGCLTDGDIRRWLIKTGELGGKISKIINRTPEYLTEECEEQAASFMASKKLRAIPIVDESHRIIKVIFNRAVSSSDKKKNDSLAFIPIVIMAGGKGSRLYPYTKALPKPLIPICDYPIIEHIIHQFQNFGARKFYVIVNYKKNMIRAYFADLDHDYDVEMIDETEELGTGGGLSLLRNQLCSTFILSNCDILIRDDFEKMLDYHKNTKNKITIISSLKKITIPYGVIQTGDGGNVISMTEKPEIAYLTNTGCYIVEKETLLKINDNEKIGFPEIIKRCKDSGLKVGTFPVSENAWLDMGQIDTMEEMEKRLSKSFF